MTSLVEWCGFVGSWLLFAGPVFQATLELREEGLERDRLTAVSAEKAQQFPKTSAWWWLFPPVRYLLERRRSKVYRDAVMSALTQQERESLVHYLNKATGWTFVGLGALLLALQETWDLREHYGWSSWVYWVVVLVMILLCSATTSVLLRRGNSLLELSPR